MMGRTTRGVFLSNINTTKQIATLQPKDVDIGNITGRGGRIIAQQPLLLTQTD